MLIVSSSVLAVLFLSELIGDVFQFHSPSPASLLSSSSSRLTLTDTQAKVDPKLKEIIVDCEKVVIDKFDDSDRTWVRTATRPSFHMHVHPFHEDAVSKDIGTNGCYECDLLPHTIYALRSRPNSVFIDIGANLGLYTLSAAAAGFDVVAFEPILMSYRKICESIQANPGFSERINVVPHAVSNTTGLVKFKWWTGNYAGVSIGTTDVNSKRILDGKTLEGVDYGRTLEIDRLQDNILPTNRPVVLKVDIEGAECEAMSGALKYFEQVEILYAQIELNPVRSGKRCSNIQDIADFFTRKGLQPYLMFNGQKELDSSKAKEWKSPKPGGNMDVGWFPEQRQ